MAQKNTSQLISPLSVESIIKYLFKYSRSRDEARELYV